MSLLLCCFGGRSSDDFHFDGAAADFHEFEDTFRPLVAKTYGAMSQSDVGRGVQACISKFFEGTPMLLDMLNMVSQIHPFAEVAVKAFGIVITLVQKRKENNARVFALYIEMKELMVVVLSLKQVPGKPAFFPNQKAKIFDEKMQELFSRIGTDIKKCGNTCDAYSKKSLIARVVQGTSWEKAFSAYSEMFLKHRDEIQRLVNFRTAVIVVQIDEDVQSAKRRFGKLPHSSWMKRMCSLLVHSIDELTALFKEYMTNTQKAVSEYKNKHAQDNSVDRDKYLMGLIQTSNEAEQGGTRPTQSSYSQLQSIKKELELSVKFAIRDNRIYFDRKFELQKQELEDVIDRQAQRILKAVAKGAHERVSNKDMRNLWEENRWGRNVKARSFVQALRDYFQEKVEEDARNTTDPEDRARRKDDEWAVQQISLRRLPAILEAFDDDGSGYISTAEINRFTAECPDGWSLLLWMAYWASGWKSSVRHYARLIEEIFAKMYGMLPAISDENRREVDQYHTVTWENVHTLTAAVEDGGEGEHAKFQSYIDTVENRLKKQLEDVEYVIDGPEMVYLIVGKGRLEKSLFPLIYLLLDNHLLMMQEATSKILSSGEISAAAMSLAHVNTVVNHRVTDLRQNFEAINAGPRPFKTFACGMFKYVNEKEKLWTAQYVQDLISPIITYTADEKDNVPSPEGSASSTNSRDANMMLVRRNPLTTFHWGVVCDHCGHDILDGARLTCLDCTPSPFHPVNLCTACMNERVLNRRDLQTPHESYHHLVKLHTMLHLRHYGEMYRAARKAFRWFENKLMRLDIGQRKLLTAPPGRNIGVPQQLPQIAIGEGEPIKKEPIGNNDSGLRCNLCNLPLSLPCWYCVNCGKCSSASHANITDVISQVNKILSSLCLFVANAITNGGGRVVASYLDIFSRITSYAARKSRNPTRCCLSKTD
ncbi:hypothetical protein EVG20_g5265 [Dentipellis fragilis]|uniref:EF-hand domain-containing protein n=1 Tax=Dentipellis fragilis TaxID=205917 RepID=A0A4Y9YTR8_9AGAM|nr:hypothetical protein EVG20_g5265 [Dentipellis fragilis]